MALAMRMRRIGKCSKKKFYFRVGVINETSSRDGKVLEDIGIYDPSKKSGNFKIKMERFDYWKSKGAVISPTLKSLVKADKKKVSA